MAFLNQRTSCPCRHHRNRVLFSCFMSVTFPLKQRRGQDASCSTLSCVSLLRMQLHSWERSNLKAKLTTGKNVSLFSYRFIWWRIFCLFWVQPLIPAANKAVSAKYSQVLYYGWNLKKKLKDICCSSVYIALALKERSSVWRTHSLFWKQPSCHGSHCTSSTLQEKRNQWSQSVFAQPTRSQCLSSTKIWAHI